MGLGQAFGDAKAVYMRKGRLRTVSGYVMPACAGLCLLYNTKGKREKGLLYGVFSFLLLGRERHLMCVHIHPEAFSNQC